MPSPPSTTGCMPIAQRTCCLSPTPWQPPSTPHQEEFLPSLRGLPFCLLWPRPKPVIKTSQIAWSNPLNLLSSLLHLAQRELAGWWKEGGVPAIPGRMCFSTFNSPGRFCLQSALQWWKICIWWRECGICRGWSLWLLSHWRGWNSNWSPR